MPSLRKDAASDRELLITSWSANFASGLTYLSIDHRRKSVPAPDPIQKMETLKPEEKRKLSGAQKNYPLDRFKPYQRPKRSDGGHGTRRWQPRRPAAVGSYVRSSLHLCQLVLSPPSKRDFRASEPHLLSTLLAFFTSTFIDAVTFPQSRHSLTRS